MNLGIDFGSTYSMLSYYDEKDDVVRSVQSQHSSNYIPSVACCDDDGKLITGQDAKEFLTQDSDAVAYRAFKMLLTEPDSSRLAQMNYNETYTPRYIAKEFLRQQMCHARTRCATQKFEKVVICIPQVWNTDIYTMSGKAILQEICMELKEEEDILNTVTVVSEPAAASAYFAYSYRKKSQKDFNGRMLIVDYGGGTLDISLTKVTTVVKEDGSTAMEIDVEGETGAGENHGKQIGDAGIAYLEGTVRLALKEAGIEDVPYDGNFLNAVNRFESTLIGQTDQIREMIRVECANKVARLKNKHDVFVTLRYRGKKVPVTYSIIYQAYNQIIKPVLDEQLTKVRDEYLAPLLKSSGRSGGEIKPEEYIRDLKFALVGGFGQFELVRLQVYDFFKIHQTPEDGGREDAICYGAALLSHGLVSLRKTAKLSMGLVTTLRNKKTFDFAITKQMELEYDRVYYMPNPIIFGGNPSSDKEPWEFAIGRGNDTNKAYRLVPRSATQDKLNKLEPERTYTFGFSVDDSDIYSIHVIPTDGDVCYENEGRKIRLGNFSDIFGRNVTYLESDVLHKPRKA